MHTSARPAALANARTRVLAHTHTCRQDSEPPGGSEIFLHHDRNDRNAGLLRKLELELAVRGVLVRWCHETDDARSLSSKAT